MQLHVDDCVPQYADVDASRATQVLTNLLTNAIKFCPPGGTVRCDVDMEEGTDCLRARVRDTGIGLSEEGMERLFKLFSQAEGSVTKMQFGGTGLGLVISRDLCRSMVRTRAAGEIDCLTCALLMIAHPVTATRKSDVSL